MIFPSSPRTVLTVERSRFKHDAPKPWHVAYRCSRCRFWGRLDEFESFRAASAVAHGIASTLGDDLLCEHCRQFSAALLTAEEAHA